MLAEAQRIVRSTGHAADDTLAQRITAAALAEPISLPLARIDDGDMGEPAALRRRDGSSVYTRHGTALYTSAEILSAERRILHAATLDGGRTVADTDVEIALADSAARGKDLNPGQVALVTEMATNGRRVALALAPAGAGKTTAMAALSHAWRNSGGTVLIFNTTRRKRLNLHDFEQSFVESRRSGRRVESRSLTVPQMEPHTTRHRTAAETGCRAMLSTVLAT